MRAAGYLAKHIEHEPAGLPASSVTSIFSVSGCISRNFADYIRTFKELAP